MSTGLKTIQDLIVMFPRHRLHPASDRKDTALRAVDIPAAVYPHDTSSVSTATCDTATARSDTRTQSTISVAPELKLQRRNPDANPDDLAGAIPSTAKSQESTAPQSTIPETIIQCLPSIGRECPSGYTMFLYVTICWCRLNDH